jgi:glycosyltransferase involved in cell wall biosynthesis
MMLIMRLKFGFRFCAASETLHIAFVIPSLGPGGAERVATLLVNHWVGQRHDVTLVTFGDTDDRPFFELEHSVVVRGLAASTAGGRLATQLGRNAARVWRLRSVLKEIHPDVVVAFMTEANVVALWASRGCGVPVVISERNQPDRPGLGGLHRLARRVSYTSANALVVQTEDIATWARRRFRIPIHIIPNPVKLQSEGPQRNKSDVRFLISLGRLAPQKGFDILIRSFAALAGRHPDWQLIIYGDGPDRTFLERLRSESGCAARIFLPGLTRDSAEALRQASLFVLPSRFEGYPNVLLEALAVGLPVVATACPGGTADILKNGLHGMLVTPDDVSALTAALDVMMSAPASSGSHSALARHAVAELDIALVGQRWIELLLSVGANSNA